MNAMTIPVKAASEIPETQNERFKKSFGSLLWGSMIAATLIHFVLFQFWPTLTVEDVSFTVEDLRIIELPPEIEVPPAPEAITRPATPVMAVGEIDDNITIALTTFEDNPISELLPPPPAEGEVRDISAAPVFTPMTVAPEIKNVAEIQQALARLYPTVLRDADLGGTVLVWFFISEEGRVLETMVHTSSGYPQLDQAALDVADIFEFSPALNREAKVQVWIQFPIRFLVQ